MGTKREGPPGPIAWKPVVGMASIVNPGEIEAKEAVPGAADSPAWVLAAT